jgi:hypothetical protein
MCAIDYRTREDGTMMMVLQILGGFVLAAGVLLAAVPELVNRFKGPDDTPLTVPRQTGAAISRRIRWGWVIAVGYLLMYPPIGLGVLPVLVTLAVAGIAGIMTARLMGLMLDGIDMRHLFRFAAESLILGGLWTWFVKLSA